MMHVYIEDIAAHEGREVTIKGWLASRRSSGKIHFLQLRDGIRLHSGGDVEGRGRRGDVPRGRPPRAGERRHRARHRARGLARAGRLRDRRGGARGRLGRPRLPHHAQGARRRLPDGPAPPVDPRAAPAGHPAHPPRGHRRGPRLLQHPRLHPCRHANLHAVGVRGHDDAVPGAVLRRHDGVPHAERTALQRGQCDGARTRLLLRPDVPRREVQDAPAPDGVLDGRARGGVRHARGRHRPGRRPRRRRRRARPRPAATRAEGARAEHGGARAREGPVPAAVVRRCRRAAQEEGPAVRVGRRLRRPGRNGDLRGIRSARRGRRATRRRSRPST